MSQEVITKPKKAKMSQTRKLYILKLIGRIAVLLASVAIFIWRNEWLDVIEGFNFFDFSKLSPLHLLWLIWMVDMILQLIPVKGAMPLGSQKYFKSRFKPAAEFNAEKLRAYINEMTKSAYKVFIVWSAALLVMGVLYAFGVINAQHLFLVSVAFYVCDLICVLIWCPFRLLMRTRCCTSCRIFNWDHLMMFSPLIFVGSFFSYSLVIMAFAIWLIWEVSVMMHPERFWDKSNCSLKCSECTDKLCTQFCKRQKRTLR